MNCHLGPSHLLRGSGLASFPSPGITEHSAVLSACCFALSEAVVQTSIQKETGQDLKVSLLHL